MLHVSLINDFDEKSMLKNKVQILLGKKLL